MRISQEGCFPHIQSFLISGLVLASVSVSFSAFALQATPESVTRFTVLTEFNNEAVRAQQRCLSSNTGGRKNWRVPTVQELNTLIDPSSTEIKLPDGHPFTNVEPAIYWSATKAQKNATSALFVNFSSGGTATLEKYMSTFVWCVRDGMKN
jgi:phage baseplate assembly protein gpV